MVVTLLDGEGNFITTTTTDDDGLYAFTGLTPGDYIVEFPTDNGLAISPQNQGGDDAFDSDANPADGRTGVVTLTSGQDDLTVDAGYFQTASIGDRVFADQNANGIQDAGDAGIAGITVNLLVDGAIVTSTATDDQGFYQFTNLTPGTEYVVQFPTDNGFVVSPQDQGGDDTVDSDANPTTGLSDVIVLASGEMNTTVDAGYYETGSIGDRVFVDANGNGIQDAGEVGQPGVVVTLLDGEGNFITTTTTDDDGLYAFTGLTPGDYIVEFPTDNGLAISPQNQGGDDAFDSDANPADGRTGVVTLTSGQDDLTVDAGYFQTASIGDRVFADQNANGIQDAGDAGIAGITVNLLVDGAIVTSTATDDQGFYQFTNLTPGTEYVVQFPTDNGFVVSPQDQGGDDTVDSDANPTTGLSDVIVLASGEMNTTVDAGYYETGSIGDRVFVDANGNGIQDAGEVGQPGVVVTLLDGEGNFITTTTTDDDGLYAFTGLTPGDYIVEFPTDNGLAISPQNQGGDDAFDSDANPADGRTGVVTLTSGQDDLTVDAGYFQTASIGDRVFADQNANGIQDAGDAGIAGITVNLLVDGAIVTSTATDDQGFYQFTNLTPGTEYVVQFPTDNGFVVSPQDQGGDDTVDSDANPTTGLSDVIVLASGEMNTTVDAGYYETGSIGDRVFVDANGNGIQDAGEVGQPGVVVTLLDGEGNFITTTTTDDDGLYAFTGLTPGDYIVEFPTDNGLAISPQNQGGDDAFDSDANPADGRTGVVTLTSGQDDLTVDAGYFQTASIGDRVFADQNANGIQDAGDAGIAGITVNLLVDGAIVTSTATDDQGFYQFTNLTPGTEYVVQFPTDNGFVVSPQDQGGDDTVDSDANPTTGLSDVIVLASGEMNTTVDAGYYETGSIGRPGLRGRQRQRHPGCRRSWSAGCGGYAAGR